MRKSFKLLLLGLGVVLLLEALGVGAVFAADPPTNPTDYQKTFLGKVAKILGIDEQRVTDAFKQASKETNNEMIDKALADGRITKEWADWLKQRPDDGTFGPGFKGMMRGGKWGGRMGGHFGGLGKSVPAPTPTP